MINKVTLIGNLGKDPEIRTLDNGRKVASFTVATSENYKDNAGEWQTVTEWHNVSAWGKWSDYAERLQKGQQVYIEGKNKTRSYEKDGHTFYRTEVVANYIRTLTKSERGEATEPAGMDEDTPF